jgi:hypothetical protein
VGLSGEYPWGVPVGFVAHRCVRYTLDRHEGSAVFVIILKCSFHMVVLLTCKLCKQECTIIGSKTAPGGDPLLRLEDRCVSQRRNMERRVKDRARDDKLRVFWNNLIADKDKLAKWLIKMKSRNVGDKTTDAQLLVYVDEFKKELEEERKQKDWYYPRDLRPQFRMSAPPQ